MMDIPRAIGWMALLVVFLVVIVTGEENAVQNGKIQYEIISRDTRLPRYGDCWKNSLSSLEQGCKALTDELQSRLALKFANCFLAMSGQTTYPCDEEEEISKCLESVDNKAFSAFSNFFTHTHNMCQFLQDQVWHERTEEVIGKLSQNSVKVAAAISNWSQLQDKILDNQVATLEYQRQIMENGSMLSIALESSRENARQLMEEFKSSTDEQKALIFSIFDRVTKLQGLVVSEVSWLYTVLFYAVFLIFVYVMTSMKRTEDARFPLLVLFTLNAAIERVICTVTVWGTDGFSDMDVIAMDVDSLPEVVSARIWLARKLSLLLSLIVLGYSVYSFKDYNILNNQMLINIQNQNLALQKALKEIQSTTISSAVDATDSKRLLHSFDLLPAESVLRYDGDSDVESNSSTLSFNSAQTDRTWMNNEGSQLGSSCSEDEDIHDNFLDDVLNNLTPNPTPEPEAIKPVGVVEDVASGHLESVPKKKGRPKGSRNSTPRRSVTPQLNSSPCRYNLRNRSFMQQEYNPILETESAEEFGKLINKASRISRQNAEQFVVIRNATMKRY